MITNTFRDTAPQLSHTVHPMLTSLGSYTKNNKKHCWDCYFVTLWLSIIELFF